MLNSILTAPIEDDPDFTFEDYLWRCINVYVVYAALPRGDKVTEKVSKIPERIEIPAFYRKDLAQEKAKVAELRAMSPAEYAKKAQDAFVEATSHWEKADADRRARLARYDAILAKVHDWKPPNEDFEDFDGLHMFMVEKIEDSSRVLRKPWGKPLTPPTVKEAAERLADRIKYGSEAVARLEERIDHAQKQIDVVNGWFAIRKTSVPKPK